MANLQNRTVNHNLDAFRKAMKLLNVVVWPNKLVYHLPNNKLAESCIPDAEAIIKSQSSPLRAYVPKRDNVLIIEPLEEAA